MTDTELLILIRERISDPQFRSSVKRLFIKPDKKITFEECELYDKRKFKERFPEWTKEKLLYYYNSADAYSTEGNKYVDWGKAIANWAARDEKKGIKFAEAKETKLVYSGSIYGAKKA